MATVRSAVTSDDFGAAKATRDRYKAEEEAKQAAVKQAARELSQAWTTLKMYEVRASIDGVDAPLAFLTDFGEGKWQANLPLPAGIASGAHSLRLRTLASGWSDVLEFTVARQ